MDFAILPPEINSARMYAGAGSGPMLAAASAWDALAAELHSTASAYQSAITGLTAGPWLGPSATMMAQAAAPYVMWMRMTAAQAEQTANQAVAAAAAYETAFAGTVPPPVIAANRSLLAALVASNFFGQNTSAIAATETQYSEMWAQDTGAMQSYAGASAAATRLQRFNSPSSNTDTGGETEQAAAVDEAARTPAGNVQNALSLSPASTFAPASDLAAPAAAADPLSTLALASDVLGVFVDPPASVSGLAVDATALPYDVVGALTGFHTDNIVSGWAGSQSWPGTDPVPPTKFPVITNLGTPASTVSANLADATSVGRMSVPATWAAAAPEFRLSALAMPALPATTIAAAAEASTAGAGSVFSQMALASMAGRAMAGTTGTGGAGLRDRIGAATGKSAKGGGGDAAEPLPGGPITGISAELRELFALRDAGILTQDEFVEQKQRLLPRDP
jgi:PPE-repeat protein